MQARSPSAKLTASAAPSSASTTEQALWPAPSTLSPEAALLLHEARNTAFAEASQGRLVRGMNVLAEALGHEPMSHDLLSDMAALLLASGELEAAAAYANRALHLLPTHGASLYTLAFAQSGQGELLAARNTLRTLMQPPALDSLLADGADLLSLVRLEAGRLEGLKLD